MNATTEAARIVLENSLANSVFVGGIAWGAHAAVFLCYLYVVYKNWEKAAGKWLLIVCPLFGLATVSLLSGYAFHLAFAKEWAYSGGPLAFWAAHQSSGWSIAALVTAGVSLASSYAFLLYCYFRIRPSDRFVQLIALCLAVLLCVYLALDARTIRQRVRTPLPWEALAKSELPFDVIMRFPPFYVTAVAFEGTRAAQPTANVKTRAPRQKALIYQYIALLGCTCGAPMLVLIVAMLCSLVFFGTGKATRAFAAAGVQLAPIAAELLVVFIVQPPDKIRKALGEGAEDAS